MFEVTEKVRKEVKKDILKIMATKPIHPPAPLQIPRYLYTSGMPKPRLDGERSEP